MVSPLMLLCKYGDRTIVFKVVSNCALKDLTDFLSCKLKKFDNSGCILLLYCLPGHSQCMIDDDSDFQNMLSLVYPLGVDRVDVTITEMGISNEKHGVGESGDATGSNITDDEMDLLPMFCQHEKRTFLSCGWVNEITHVGQRFIGGAKDFRTALCKYAIEIGFEFISYTCRAAVRTSKNSRMSSNLVASLIVNEVRGNPQTRPIDVFKRFFVAFNASIQGFRHCRPLLFIDGTFLNGKYKGTLLIATTKDGDQGFFPLAMAIVDTETTDSWEWLFIHLSNILLDERPITFISDRNAGLLETLPKVLPTAYHYFCLQHLKANLRDRFSGPSFNNTFKRQKYGEMHSNVAESFNSWIHQARHLPTTKMIDSIRLKIMALMSRRREQAKKWNTFLCPEMDSTLVNALKSRRTWLVSRSSNHVFEVQSRPSVSVDLLNRTCSCYQWQLNGFLCAYAATAIQKSGGDLYAHMEPFYYTSKFKDCYAESVYPIPTVEKSLVVMDDLVVLPPIYKKQPGRPRKNRIPSRCEKIRQVQCGRCEKYGHNRKTCKETFS
ncbi:uncharacterized protein LOC114278223 [Camellia sinensis]|uniref:uncharacterized protein LOC114278223 n=1 Tax=Camellia sinensis TaxID=4442 RepID=UPI00103699ED|nr:uncharacterized protein LOC114278223 [Camellia sinensis]